MFATGHQQGTELQLVHQLRPLGDQLCFVSAAADDGLELTEVRRYQAGAAINREILALGVGQYRNTLVTGRLDQDLVIFQGALAVVRQHQDLDTFKQLIDLSAQ
ncbi:hypothetical protein D3C76_1212080 [compost metagenome]